MIDKEYLHQFIENALREDIGDGDHTSLSCIPPDKTGKAQLLVKEDGIIAGVEIAAAILAQLEPKVKIEILIKDGCSVKKADVVFIAEGTMQTLLKAERLLLNVMQRMSGIATQTAIYVKKIEGTGARILDTRKTTPGMRLLDKLAVKLGGGENHRIGLYDMILIKDNHIDFAGGIEKAIQRASDYCRDMKKNLKIEIEARSLEDVQRIMLFGKIHRIMLDNFTIENTKKAVEIIGNTYEIESSGNITLETIRNYAACGVNFISVGALTHQIKSLDLSFKALI